MLVEGAGEIFQEAREGARLSQPELGHRTGVSTWTISNIETGRQRSPRRRTVRALCEELGLQLTAVWIDDATEVEEGAA